MTPVLDANVLLRLADPQSPLHAAAAGAVRAAAVAYGRPATVPQGVYEFWVVATRPLAQNGLGLTVPECVARLDPLVARFPVLPDPPGLFGVWRRLVELHDCKGKPAHGARIAAALSLHGLTHLVTFSAADFARFPHLVILDPAATAAVPPGP